MSVTAAKDIPDQLVIDLVTACNEARCDGERYGYEGWHGGRYGHAQGEDRPEKTHWMNRWDLGRALSVELGCDVPERVLLAKLRRLIDQRHLLTGCSCGCRGDLEVPGVR